MLNIEEKAIIEQREQTQEDVLCILDGVSEPLLNNVCQVIVDRFNILISKGKENA